MSEHHLEDPVGIIQKDDSDGEIPEAGEEDYDPAEDTLQITDIHETTEFTNNQDVSVNLMDFSLAPMYQPSLESPFSIQRLLPSNLQNSGSESQNLQTELALLGFNCDKQAEEEEQLEFGEENQSSEGILSPQSTQDTLQSSDLQVVNEHVIGNLSMKVHLNHSSYNSKESYVDEKHTDIESPAKKIQISEDKNKSNSLEVLYLINPEETEIKEVTEDATSSGTKETNLIQDKNDELGNTNDLSQSTHLLDDKKIHSSDDKNKSSSIEILNLTNTDKKEMKEVFEDAICSNAKETNLIQDKNDESVNPNELSQITHLLDDVENSVVDLKEDLIIKGDPSCKEMLEAQTTQDALPSSNLHVAKDNGLGNLSMEVHLSQSSCNSTEPVSDERHTDIESPAKKINCFENKNTSNCIEILHVTTPEETEMEEVFEDATSSDIKETNLIQNKNDESVNLDVLSQSTPTLDDVENSVVDLKEDLIIKGDPSCKEMLEAQTTQDVLQSSDLQVINVHGIENLSMEVNLGHLCTSHASFNSKSLSEVVETDLHSDPNNFEFQLQTTEEEKSTINFEETSFKLPEEIRTIQVLETQKNYNDLTKDKAEDVFEDATRFKTEQIDYVIDNEPSLIELSKTMPVLDCDKNSVVDEEHKVVNSPEKEEIVLEGLLPYESDPIFQKSLPYENAVAVSCPCACNSNDETECPCNDTAPLRENPLGNELPKSVVSKTLKNNDFSNDSHELKTCGSPLQGEITMRATDTLDVSMNMSMTFIGGVIDTSLAHDVQSTASISHLQAVSDDFHKDNNYGQNDNLLQNVTDFVNSNIAETNDFTTYLDQKMCDALYVPLSHSNVDSNPSTFENGLQSFMEITMANTNPAMFDQSIAPYSYSQIVKQSRRNFCEEKSSEENDSVKNEFTNSIVLMGLKENNTDFQNNKHHESTSHPSLDFSSCGSSHEILQQSMSDYVTNRSFNLAIPDCDLDQNSTQDNELRKQCERQAENVLLMKWPAHFHDQLNALKSENQLLLEQLETFKQNDVCISNLKQENLELYNKLQEITKLSESQKKALQDFELVGQLKVNSNDSQLIVELTEENNKLKELNDESKTLNLSLKEENELLWNELKKDIEKLDKLKLDNEHLLKELEDKNSEICCLKSDRKKLKNVLIKANDKLNDLESENEYLNTLLQESNIQTEESNVQAQTMTVLREENKQLLLEIKSLKDSIEGFEGESAIFMQDLSSLGETISSLLDEKRVLMEQVADLADKNERITELNSEKQHFIQHISNVEYNVSKLQEEKFLLMVQLENVTEKFSEVTELNELVRELERHVSSLNEELMSEVTKNDLILVLNKDLEDQIIEINKDKTNMQNSVSILKQTLLSENHSLKSQLDTIQQTINDLEKQTTCLNEELQNEVINNHTLLSKNELLESQINEMFEEKLQLQNSISLLRQNLVDSQAQNNLAKDQLSEHLKEKEQALHEEKLNLTSENDQLKFEIKNIQETVNKLHSQVTNLNEQLKQDESKQQALITTNNDLQNQILLISQEKFHLECSLSELEQNLVDLQAQSSLAKEQLTETLRQKEQTLLEENKNLMSENEQLKCEIKSIQETVNDLQNHLVTMNEDLKQEESKQHALITTNNDLQNQILLISQEKSHLECSLSELEQNLLDVMTQSNLSKEQLAEQLRAKEQTLQEEKHSLVIENDKLKYEIESIRETNTELESKIAFLNDELNQLNTKQQSLLVAQKDLENQILKISEEKFQLENSLSVLEQNLVDIQDQNNLARDLQLKLIEEKEQIIQDLNNNQTSLESCVKSLTNQTNILETENGELKRNLQSVQETVTKLNEDKQNLYNLLESNKDLEQKYIILNEAKFELESKLEIALAKETNILSLEEENKNLSEKLQTLVGNEEVIQLLKNEKIDLELQIKNLSDSVDKLLSDNKEMEVYVKDNSDLRLTMLQEIQSLTGETDTSCLNDGCPIINVYHKLMSEFLTKEKEVIFALQNECETKTKTKQIELDKLQGILKEKEVLSSKLMNDIEELREEVGQHNTTVINLKNELHTIKNELMIKENEVSEVKDELMIVKNEKASLLIELNSQHDAEVVAELEDKIQFLNNEINCKTDEICGLNSEILKLKSVQEDFMKQSESDKHLLNQQQEKIQELTSKLKYTEESLAEIDMQLQSKFQEVNQLNEGLESKQKEIEGFADKVKELTLVKTKLNEVESEIGFILQCFNPMNDDFDMHEALLRCSHHCQSLAELMKSITFCWKNITAKFESLNSNLKSELEKRVEMCRSLEIQINCLNEELKAHKMLYDEDILQFKEEISAKNAIVTDLTDSNSKLKKECDDLVVKINKIERDNKDVKELHEEIKKLKEVNHNLTEASKKFNVFKEVNKKLSLEIEDLSRSIKIEKQSTSELKAKCDTANYQLAELKKENFSLEDKIEVLENKLLNHDIISSIKIAFPYNMSTIDKQVTFINEKLGELEQVKSQFENLLQDHNNLKHEYEKSTEYIKRQAEKLSKILKRELDLKKQMVSSTQNSLAEHKILEELKSQLFALFPDEDSSLNKVVVSVKGLIEENKSLKQGSPAKIEELERLLEEVKQDNKDLDNECEMMHKHIKEQEELLASVLKREEELKKLNSELKTQVTNVATSTPTENFDELLMLFPEKPPSLSKALELVKNSLSENQSLKEKIAETQEEYENMDKECEQMYRAYQEKEKVLVDVLNREAKYVEDMKVKEDEFAERLKQLSEELQEAKHKLITNPSKPADCQCEVLKSRLAELKLDVADRNAKITALELQFEADNFPIKKKAADLEKSLDQAKHKISELKAEVRRYQEQMHEVTVGLRTECERCRRDAALREESSVQTSPSVTADTTILAQKNKEIAILKALCKSRNQRIAELEQGSSNSKPSRLLRSALKEGKENSNPPPTPL